MGASGRTPTPTHGSLTRTVRRSPPLVQRNEFFRPNVISNSQAACHYWSVHSGGNWLLGDGSVRFLTSTVATLVNMSSINGGEVVRE